MLPPRRVEQLKDEYGMTADELITALITPIAVQSVILRKELPILIAVTALSALLVWDGLLTRWDAVLLLAVFGGLIAWSIVAARGQGRGTAASAL